MTKISDVVCMYVRAYPAETCGADLYIFVVCSSVQASVTLQANVNVSDENKDFLRCRLTDELDELERCYLQVDGRHAACEHPHQNLIVPWLRQVGRLCCKCIAFEHNASSHYLKLILVPAASRTVRVVRCKAIRSNFTKRRNERKSSLQINEAVSTFISNLCIPIGVYRCI